MPKISTLTGGTQVAKTTRYIDTANLPLLFGQELSGTSQWTREEKRLEAV